MNWLDIIVLQQRFEISIDSLRMGFDIEFVSFIVMQLKYQLIRSYLESLTLIRIRTKYISSFSNPFPTLVSLATYSSNPFPTLVLQSTYSYISYICVAIEDGTPFFETLIYPNTA